jgi:hypothetical protein
MYMQLSTDATGKPFDAAIIEAVWNKAALSREHPPMRVDAFGALMWREGYGNTASKFGWEIVRRHSPSEGGGDELENLQAVQWENNRRNGRGF